ncbi:hypothetical protein Ahy_B08g089584 isoform B [Arachis hypogaea]|uniref:Uncharacterized protein n=1 Tax=Arachis hypogaea TaxID=3818 RepID=A0A444XYA5_ARAHY|nr:hypothetical protein Ahy_B08g089584 isoform B [Arachis hypogaea]
MVKVVFVSCDFGGKQGVSTVTRSPFHSSNPSFPSRRTHEHILKRKNSSVPLGSGGSDWDFDPLFSTSPYCIRKFRWGTFGMGSGLPETRNSMENNINNVKTQSDHWPGY